MTLAYPYRIFPLRVLKQIVVMFFSACGPSLRKAHPGLVGFVLNREQCYFPHGVHIWAYLRDPVESKATRQSGVTGLMSLRGDQRVFSEIAFPPFGLIWLCRVGVECVPAARRSRSDRRDPDASVRSTMLFY
jgi:hypothetical protein